MMEKENGEFEMKNEQFLEIKNKPELAFLSDLQKALPNGQFFLVGGFVRDALLGRESREYDFLLAGVDKEKTGETLKKLGRVEEVESRAFGVFKFAPKGVKLSQPME